MQLAPAFRYIYLESPNTIFTSITAVMLNACSWATTSWMIMSSYGLLGAIIVRHSVVNSPRLLSNFHCMLFWTASESVGPTCNTWLAGPLEYTNPFSAVKMISSAPWIDENCPCLRSTWAACACAVGAIVACSSVRSPSAGNSTCAVFWGPPIYISVLFVK